MSLAESPDDLLARLAAERQPATPRRETRLAISGGRDYHPDPAELAALLRLIDRLNVVELHHGDCRGADREAVAHVARHRPSLRIIVHPPDWNTHGKAAGPIRNKAMLLQVNALAHFPGGRGAEGCIAEARRQGRALFDLAALAVETATALQADHL